MCSSDLLRRAFSRRSCPWVTGPWQWRAAQAPGRGGVESDLCSHTGFLVAAAAALASPACLWSLCCQPRLAPISGVRLGGALNPLSLRAAKQRGKKKSLASLAAADFFPDSLSASTDARASAPSPRPPRRVSRQAPRAGERCLAPSLCVGTSPLCPLHPCGCALLRGSEASPLCHPQSLPTKGFPSVWKPFLLHSSLPRVQVPSLFFCLCCFYFLLPYPVTWGVSCLLGSLRSSLWTHMI